MHATSVHPGSPFSHVALVLPVLQLHGRIIGPADPRFEDPDLHAFVQGAQQGSRRRNQSHFVDRCSASPGRLLAIFARSFLAPFVYRSCFLTRSKLMPLSNNDSVVESISTPAATLSGMANVPFSSRL